MEKQVSRRDKRYKAKRLFLTKKYTSIQICEMVGVTQATMSKWIKRYGWKNPETAGFTKSVEASGVIQTGFYNHLKSNNPGLLEEIYMEIMDYMEINKSITVGQSDKIKELAARETISEKELCFSIREITENRTNKLSRLTYNEAAYLIELLSKDDQEYEITIKKVTP